MLRQLASTNIAAPHARPIVASWGPSRQTAKLRVTVCGAGKKGKSNPSGTPPTPVSAPPMEIQDPKAPVPAPSLTDDPTPAPSSKPDSAGPTPVLFNIKSPSAAAIDKKGGVEMAIVWRKAVKELSSLPLAIGLMATIAGLSGLGTVLPQNKSFNFYFENYPNEGPKVLGFLTKDLIFFLQLDHIYTAWYFFGAILVLGFSLMACTYTRQWPAVKVAQRWRFQSKSAGVVKMGNAEVLPDGQLQDLGAVLTTKGYQVFIQKPSLYAFKGLAGRIGPIGVHLALILVLGGTAYSGFGTIKGSAMCPEGQDFVVAEYLQNGGPLSSLPEGSKTVMHVDKFTIDYRPNGQVAQFYSDLSLYDFEGNELMRKQISVNDPFRYGGVTAYQTDWSLAAISLHVLNPEMVTASTLDTGTFSLPLADLTGKPGINGKLWGTFLPVSPPTDGNPTPKGFSFVAQDPESVVVYGTDGKFVGVRRTSSGKPLEVEGIQIVFDKVVGSTGLELKSDPGVPWVYAGFGGLMITTLVSYLSHSQVWAVKEGQYLYVGGKSNRALLGFKKEFDEVLDSVPEVPEEQAQTA